MSKVPIDLVIAMLAETAHLKGAKVDLIDNDTIPDEELDDTSRDTQDDYDEICNCSECDFCEDCNICHCDDECDDDGEWVDEKEFWSAFKLLIAASNESFGSFLIKDAKILRNTKKRTTTVIWSDGTVTVVKAAKGEKMNDYHAFTAAFAKRMLRSNTKINNIVDKTVEMQLSPKKEKTTK